MIFLTCGLMSHSGYELFVDRMYKRAKKIRDDESANLVRNDIDQSKLAEILLNDLFFANAVDNFNAYLSSLILSIIRIDPRSIYGKMVETKYIFEIDDIDSLKSEIIDRMIIELGYQNINDLASFLKKNFGIVTLSHWLVSRRLNRIIQIRNIISHNRGVVNRLFMQRSGSKIDKLGEHVKAWRAIRVAGYLDNLIDKIDREAVLKFQLHGVHDA
jgi:hypothetical protein